MRCPFCSHENNYLALTCDNCYAYIYPEEEEYERIQKKSNKTYNPMAMLSFVLGLTSISISICYPLGIVNGIAAIITGFKARKLLVMNYDVQKGQGIALTGIICGFIALLGSLTLAILDYFWKISSLYGR
jgi:hypothetical protein